LHKQLLLYSSLFRQDSNRSLALCYRSSKWHIFRIFSKFLRQNQNYKVWPFCSNVSGLLMNSNQWLVMSGLVWSKTLPTLLTTNEESVSMLYVCLKGLLKGIFCRQLKMTIG